MDRRDFIKVSGTAALMAGAMPISTACGNHLAAKVAALKNH